VIEAIGIVVPARNEETLLPDCLGSLLRAVGHGELTGVRVHVVVVLDSCTDGSAAAVRAAGLEPVEIDAANVGVARGAGFAEVLRRELGTPADRIWLATTDADTTVPSDWLAGQLRYERGGADLVVGTIRVSDWTGHPPAVIRRFAALYGSADAADHPHVHGANLGLRASAYLFAGGVAPLALAEDHALVAACEASGAHVVRPGDLPVQTSARRSGRAVGGFADLLVGLVAERTIT
jgi:glycosyltransferase involved in cell wall biosynthesis